jgi:3-hydroxybutyryl-CoA dehydrogenase
MGPLTLLDFTGLHTHLGSSETALREFGDPRYRPIPIVRSLVRGGMVGRASGRGFYDYTTEKPRAAIAKVLRQSDNTSPVRVVAAGPDAVELPETAGAEAITLYSCHRPPTAADLAAITSMAGRVVIDSSDGHWLDVLPADVGWLRLHRSPRGELFAEVVNDEIAGVRPTPAVTTVLGALGAESVEVLALPGLVADRLTHCMINEACAVLEEGTADRDDVDTALTLGMNHPFGPFALLDAAGATTVHRSLRSMAELTGDPRYRPAQYLRRLGAKASR